MRGLNFEFLQYAEGLSWFALYKKAGGSLQITGKNSQPGKRADSASPTCLAGTLRGLRRFFIQNKVKQNKI